MTLDDFLKLPGANEWRGGEPPVSGDTLVRVLLRKHGTVYEPLARGGISGRPAKDWAWDLSGRIIAYREAP